MKWPYIWRKAAEADTSAWKAEANRQRERAERAEKAEQTAIFNRQQILVQNTALDAANRRLARDGGFDEARAKRAADRIARLQKAVAKARKEAAAERANGFTLGRHMAVLQKQVDDALGLNAPAVAAGDGWQDRREHHMRYDKPSAEQAPVEEGAAS